MLDLMEPVGTGRTLVPRVGMHGSNAVLRMGF
jgi:hypothetical protein